MIPAKKIKEMAGKEGKKISKSAIVKINEIFKDRVQGVIKKAARNADLLGRKIIKEEDILSEE